MKKIVLASMLAVAAMGAQAQAYVGGGFGFSEVSVDCPSYGSCDNSDTGYKFYGGYKFNPMLAIEASYINFGKSTLKVANYGNADLKANAVTLAAALRAHFTPALAGVARLGLASVSADEHDYVYGNEVWSGSESHTKLYVGLGLEYAFNKNLKGVLSADFTQAELEGSKGDVRLIGAGLQYDF